jgi:hypothetical protein
MKARGTTLLISGQGWGYNSRGRRLPSQCKAQSSNPRKRKKKLVRNEISTSRKMTKKI